MEVGVDALGVDWREFYFQMWTYFHSFWDRSSWESVTHIQGGSPIPAWYL